MTKTFVALLLKFSAGQTALQLSQAANGLVLVWLLAVPDFANYAVFTGAVGFSAVALSLGLTPTMVSLVGPDAEDRATVGRYLMAALNLRLFFLVPATLLGAGLLIYSGLRMDGAWSLIAVLCLSLLLCNYFAAQNDLYGAPLQMLGRLGMIYKLAFGSELAKLALIAGLWTSGLLEAATASLATGVSMGLNHLGLRLASRHHFLKPELLPRHEQRQLWHITLPLLPNVLFGALQGQVTIFVAALVGSASQIASVGALSRLARIMAFLQAANPMVLGPIAAKAKKERVWRVIGLVSAVAAIIALMIALTGLIAPGLLTKVLGNKYANLMDVVWIVTLGAGIGYFVSVLTTFTSFRHLVAWWSAFATIGLVIVMQVGVASVADLRTVAGVLFLGIAANIARVIVLGLVLAVARWRPNWLRDPKTARV